MNKRFKKKVVFVAWMDLVVTIHDIAAFFYFGNGKKERYLRRKEHSTIH